MRHSGSYYFLFRYISILIEFEQTELPITCLQAVKTVEVSHSSKSSAAYWYVAM